MLRRKLSAGNVNQRRFSSSKDRGMSGSGGGSLKPIDRVTQKVNSRNEDESLGKSSITHGISKHVDVRTEARNVRKLFAYMIHCLKEDNEKNCVRQLEEMYFSEVKYLENLHRLSEAKRLVLELKHNKTCMELEGTKYCRHKIKRKNCDEKTGIFEPLVNKADVDLVFISIKAIVEMHEKLLFTLRQDLSSTYENLKAGKSVTVTNIIRSFSVEYSKLAPYWMIYVEYIRRFQKSLDTLQSLKDEVEEFETNFVKIGKELNAPVMYLINEPLVRVTKYPILFKSLKKRVQKLVSSVEEPSRKIELMELTNLLNKVYIVITKAVDKVNHKIGIARNMEEMCKINKEIGDKLKKTVLLQPSRQFKREILVNRFEVGEDIMMNSDCLAFVFNDLIIVAADSSEFSKSKLVSQANKATSQNISILRRESRTSSISVASHLLSLSSIKPTPSQRSRAGSQQSFGSPSRQLRRSKKSVGKMINRNRANSVRSAKNSNLARKGRPSIASARSRSSSVGHLAKSRNFRSSFLLRSRKSFVVEEDPNTRNLTPVAEMKINRLISPEITREQVNSTMYYVLNLTYDEFTGERDIVVKFFFVNAEECQNMKQLFKTLQEEYCSKELELQKVVSKRKGSVITKYEL